MAKPGDQFFCTGSHVRDDRVVTVDRVLKREVVMTDGTRWSRATGRLSGDPFKTLRLEELNEERARSIDIDRTWLKLQESVRSRHYKTVKKHFEQLQALLEESCGK